MIKEIASWHTALTYRRFVVYYKDKVETGPDATYMEIRLRRDEWVFHRVNLAYILGLLYSNQVNGIKGFVVREGFSCVWKDKTLVYSEEDAYRAVIGTAVGQRAEKKGETR